jgi:hypothetical protein
VLQRLRLLSEDGKRIDVVYKKDTIYPQNCLAEQNLLWYSVSQLKESGVYSQAAFRIGFALTRKAIRTSKVPARPCPDAKPKQDLTDWQTFEIISISSQIWILFFKGSFLCGL